MSFNLPSPFLTYILLICLFFSSYLAHIIHFRLITEDTSFDNDTHVAAQMMDDQTVPLEIVEPSVHSLDMDTEVSVVCGGTKEGWTPVAAVVLWTRMLGVLGNVNYIESATIHAQVLTALSEIWHLLAKVCECGYLRLF